MLTKTDLLYKKTASSIVNNSTYKKTAKEYTRVTKSQPWKLVSISKDVVPFNKLRDGLIKDDFNKHAGHTVRKTRDDWGNYKVQTFAPNKRLKSVVTYDIIK